MTLTEMVSVTTLTPPQHLIHVSINSAPRLRIDLAARIVMEMDGLMMVTGHQITQSSGRIVTEMAMAMSITMK